MDTSTIVMMAAALAMVAIVYFKSPEAAQHGLSATGSLILEITPRMIAAFLLAGMFQAIVPQELIVRWMGHGSGPRGILVGMTLGGITPGGPMTHFPIIAIWITTNYNVGNSIPRSKGGCRQICRKLLLSFCRRVAVRNSME
jgi:uncharacterized protein